MSNIVDSNKHGLDGLIALYTQGKFKACIYQGTALAKQFPGDHNIRNATGAALMELGLHASARKNFYRATILNPNYFSSLDQSLELFQYPEELIPSLSCPKGAWLSYRGLPHSLNSIL